MRVLRATPDNVGSRIEVRPRGGRFVCEVGQVVPEREILIRYVEGVHRGAGRWTFERLAEGTGACYEIDQEPQGWLPRLLSHFLDFARLHSRSMQKVFDGLELRSLRWHVTPLAVERVESSFFEDRALFPPGSVEFDCALLVRGIDHEWHGRETLCGRLDGRTARVLVPGRTS